MAYINILEQPQVNEVDSLLGIKDDKVVQIDSKDSCLSGLNNLTEVQKQQVRENINALEDEAGVIDTKHLATGSVTKEKLDSGLQNELQKAERLIIKNGETTQIPAVWWYYLYVTSDPPGPVEVIPDIVFIDEYGNVFPLEKVLAGEDNNQKILQFTSLYSDSDPSDVIALDNTYISATRVTVNAPEGDICEISIRTGEEAVSDSVNNIINNTVAGITPLIVTAGTAITQAEFEKCFEFRNRNTICNIIFPIYLKLTNNNISTLSPILSASVQEYTDSSNFKLSLGVMKYGFTDAGVVNSLNIGHLTASNGTFVFDNFSFSSGSATNALGLLSGGYNNFVYRNDDLISGYVSTKPLPLASYAQYLWNASESALWEKLPWISETALEAVKANLQAKFPDATANIKQVYKQVRHNINNPIAVGDDVSQYTAVGVGNSLATYKLYIL